MRTLVSALYRCAVPTTGVIFEVIWWNDNCKRPVKLSGIYLDGARSFLSRENHYISPVDLAI
jgi:hypothetical protein